MNKNKSPMVAKDAIENSEFHGKMEIIEIPYNFNEKASYLLMDALAFKSNTAIQ